MSPVTGYEIKREPVGWVLRALHADGSKVLIGVPYNTQKKAYDALIIAVHPITLTFDKDGNLLKREPTQQ